MKILSLTIFLLLSTISVAATMTFKNEKEGEEDLKLEFYKKVDTGWEILETHIIKFGDIITIELPGECNEYGYRGGNFFSKTIWTLNLCNIRFAGTHGPRSVQSNIKN